MKQFIDSKNRRSADNSQSGQTLILTLIVTVISLVIGVAISSRAVSTLKQTSYTAQAGKAQKFADAGAEEALGFADLSTQVGTHTIDVDSDGTNDTTYTVTQVGGGTTVEASLEKDQTIQIDLTGYAANEDVELYWVKKGVGEEGSSNEAAIVVSFIYEESGQVKLSKYAYDPYSATRGNNFTAVSAADWEIPSGSGNHYKYRTTVKAPSGTTPKALRIRALYNAVDNSFVAQRTGANSFTNQGYRVTSTGTYGDAQWTVEVTKMNPALPAIFDYAIFSESDLTK